VALIALQALNAWFFAVVAGVGLTLFQQIIPRPGLASGLFTNTRRVGAIASGPIIALGALSTAGYAASFAACSALTAVALAAVGVAERLWGRGHHAQAGKGDQAEGGRDEEPLGQADRGDAQPAGQPAQRGGDRG